MRVGQKILLGGLALQVITFGIFAFVAISFDVRSYRAPALRPFQREMQGMRKLWIAFYISSVLITARSIYRTVGEHSFLSSLLLHFDRRLLTEVS